MRSKPIWNKIENEKDERDKVKQATVMAVGSYSVRYEQGVLLSRFWLAPNKKCPCNASTISTRTTKDFYRHNHHSYHYY